MTREPAPLGPFGFPEEAKERASEDASQPHLSAVPVHISSALSSTQFISAVLHSAVVMLSFSESKRPPPNRPQNHSSSSLSFPRQEAFSHDKHNKLPTRGLGAPFLRGSCS
jgi:hypothetical protein